LHVSRLGPDIKENEIFLSLLKKGEILKVNVEAIDEKERIALALDVSSPSSSVYGQKPWWLAP
ncbi:MAG: hypothetical protein ACP5VS_19165, partial [Desulfomonilaceae bacterium]